MRSLVCRRTAWGHTPPWTGHPYSHLPIRPLVGSPLYPSTVSVHFYRLHVFIMLQPSWEPCGTATIGEGRGEHSWRATPPPLRQGRCLNSDEEDEKNDPGKGGINVRTVRGSEHSSRCATINARTFARDGRHRKQNPSPPPSLCRQTIIVTSRWNAALCTGNLTFRRVRVTTVAVQKQYYIF